MPYRITVPAATINRLSTTQAYTAAPPTSIDKRSDYLSTLTSEGIRVDDQTAMDLGEKVCMELKMGMDDGRLSNHYAPKPRSPPTTAKTSS